MVSWKSSSQIVTSKKEAQKKGIYSYTENSGNKEGNPAAVTSGGGSSSDVALASTTAKKKTKTETKKVEKTPKNNKDLLVTKETDPDFKTEYTPDAYMGIQIVNNAMEFNGVRYRGGGTTKDGMDCSGMVFATFKIFDITLPRSSHEQAKVGTVIDLKETRKGDLLFFKNNRRKSNINHVGLVISNEDGDVKFIHSTLSGGVVVSSMKEAYYDRTYVQANRVL
jgi:cell wall-associated NlpC family hydrolase